MEPFKLKGNRSQYLVLKEVARGGMAIIYQAQDLENQHTVAIKQEGLTPITDQSIKTLAREQLQLQLKALGPLDHPNVPKIYDQFSDQDHEYLVMELLEGRSLMEILEQSQEQDRLLEESRVIGWALQALDALSYLHSQPQAIIHRDIKPHNLMLNCDGRVVLMDFDLMKRTDRRQISETHVLLHSLGTEQYAPPEQYADSGLHTDIRTDIYSLGATLYHLLAGQPPPRSVDRVMPVSIVDPVAKRPPPLTKINPTVGRRTEQIIFKALEIDPDYRYQSVDQLREDLCPRHHIVHLPF